MRIFDSLAALAEAEGEELGSSDWLVVDQQRIDAFAHATGDHQWIHVDPERAAEGPFGGTIAHGLLTLSLLPSLLQQIYRVDGARMAVNYGLDKVRFPSPVRSGAKLRGTSRIARITELDGAVQAHLSTVIEIEGGDKPACIVESIVRYLA
ncbi:MaoC domain-containing protein dehydratase [Streptomyces albus]|uniref:MaoC domain-containing protein dehydratase n=1 Tax=Streptomyces albus (strain ATCC 21838 / DSM 41398 / FERM P-419 / JCM 4703 / NBRC 107858) TaxID=1081613 RepID=A0A0B5ENN9_STRA4|nr:MaoC domain-containing protein dehydratase [Streptomyces albus]AOU74751.1 MaoC domain-containing protein dehydratase [Streptomyces albus]AYN30562.1 dehydratase [Streptomyces albus]